MRPLGFQPRLDYLSEGELGAVFIAGHIFSKLARIEPKVENQRSKVGEIRCCPKAARLRTFSFITFIECAKKPFKSRR